MLLAVEPYLKENIDNQLIIKDWDGKNEIPIILRSLYKFYTTTILDFSCILVEIIDQATGIEIIKKHIRIIKKITDRKIILYYKKITRYRRKSLIENRIPFVIEDGQIFLPFLGLHLKNADDFIENKFKSFSPSAQIAFLYFLYNKNTVLNTTEFAKLMGWNAMTCSRALNELYDAKLLTYELGGNTGRSKKYRRIPDPDYFKKGSQHLNSPVKKVIYAKKEPLDSFISGLEALSKLSMINPPRHNIRAINSESINIENLEIIENLDVVNDKKVVEIEIWDYDPKIFSKNGIVDIASLYASLKEEKDERIEQALIEVLGGEEWYMD